MPVEVALTARRTPLRSAFPYAATCVRAVLACIGLLWLVSCGTRGAGKIAGGRHDAGARADSGAHVDAGPSAAAAPPSDEDAGQAGCKATSDCAAGLACIGTVPGRPGRCGPRPTTDQLGDGVVGSACATNGDCGAGRCMAAERITSVTFPGGYCTGRCVEDSECGARGLCAPGFLGAVGSCYLRCDGDPDCGRDGYRCRASSGTGVCLPGPKPLPDDAAGNACASDSDCGGGPKTCARALGSVDAPGGYCSQSCALDADCGSGGLCISGVNSVNLTLGTCYRSCVPPDGCREGYECRSLSGNASDPHGACAPVRP
jgi:hypothetical protein